MDAVILAGGRGTRLRPLTYVTPKPLLPFMGEPYAAGLLRRLLAAGVTRATFLVGQDAAPWQPLHTLGERVGIAVRVVTEETALDTAGAARRLLTAGVETDVLVCNGDILTDLDLAGLVSRHREAGATATIALTAVPDTSSFGVVVSDERDRVERFVEKPPPGTLDVNTVNAGTYVLAPDAFNRFPGDGPLSFERAVFPELVAGRATVLGIASDAYWADLGTPQRYLAGHRAVLEGRCDWPDAPGMRRLSGLVAVHDSARVTGAQLDGATVIGPGCVVGAGAIVRDSVLHNDVVVGPGAQVVNAILGAACRIPAGASVGPDDVLAGAA